jgi:hypothetical protein
MILEGSNGLILFRTAMTNGKYRVDRNLEESRVLSKNTSPQSHYPELQLMNRLFVPSGFGAMVSCLKGLKCFCQISFRSNLIPEQGKLFLDLLQVNGKDLLFILQEVPDILIHIVIKILHYLQSFPFIQPVQGNLVNPFAIGSDQTAIPDPSPVIAFYSSLPVPDKVYVKDILTHFPIHGAGKPDKPVICLNMLIGISKAVLAQTAGSGFMSCCIITNEFACPCEGQGPTSSGTEDKYTHRKE